MINKVKAKQPLLDYTERHAMHTHFVAWFFHMTGMIKISQALAFLTLRMTKTRPLTVFKTFFNLAENPQKASTRNSPEVSYIMHGRWRPNALLYWCQCYTVYNVSQQGWEISHLYRCKYRSRIQREPKVGDNYHTSSGTWWVAKGQGGGGNGAYVLLHVTPKGSQYFQKWQVIFWQYISQRMCLLSTIWKFQRNSISSRI